MVISKRRVAESRHGKWIADSGELENIGILPRLCDRGSRRYLNAIQFRTEDEFP